MDSLFPRLVNFEVRPLHVLAQLLLAEFGFRSEELVPKLVYIKFSDDLRHELPTVSLVVSVFHEVVVVKQDMELVVCGENHSFFNRRLVRHLL